MKRLRSFLKTSLIGGLVVILPVTILVSVSLWLFGLITNWIKPLSDALRSYSEYNELITDLFAIFLIVFTCFFVGVLVRTRLGGFLFRTIENRILKLIPGYSMIKETVLQVFANRDESPFSSVALAQIYGNDTLATVFITDKHADGSFTVFMPTGPNPTSGLIFHLKREYVHPVDIPVQDAMRSIISCGAGTHRLLEQCLPGRGIREVLGEEGG
ncbi:MAG: DUF502 domain-containing protein [Thiohalobacterales bacterium]